jgi:hypothetical protein
MAQLTAEAAVAAAAAATAAAAAAARLHGSPSTLTVYEVTLERERSCTHRSALGPALTRWVRACGIKSDPRSVPVITLLPHYASLLSQLENLHSSNKLAATTAHNY